MRQAQFWMVWSPQGSEPTHRHETRLAARNEAERLARLAPGREFFVLEAVDLRQVNDMLRVELDMPF